MAECRPACFLHAVERTGLTPVFVSLQEFRDKGTAVWKISKVQFVYDTSEKSHFINANNGESPAEPVYSNSYSYSAHFQPASHSCHILHSAGITGLIHVCLDWIYDVWKELLLTLLQITGGLYLNIIITVITM